MKLTQRLRFAFTLQELLTVLAIIAVVTALLFPVISRARRSAQLAVDSSNFRQIATGYGLYVESSGGGDASLLHLLDSGIVPSSVMRSRLDRSDKGMLHDALIKMGPNEFIEKQLQRTPFPFISYVACDDVVRAGFSDKFKNQRSGGWMVFLYEREPGTVFPMHAFSSAPYLRLTFDGGVLKRRLVSRDLVIQGRPSRGFEFDDLFMDLK